MIEKCFHCKYEGDKVSESCDYHVANPDPTIEEGGEIPALPTLSEVLTPPEGRITEEDLSHSHFETVNENHS